MTFECKDLERALAVPELMPDAVRHAKTCERCHRELRLWNEISNVAPGLHQDWDSPNLWPRIRSGLEAERITANQRANHVRNRARWAWAVAAAAVVLIAAALLRFSPSPPPPANELLTEQALRNVEQAEAAYVQAIEKLSQTVQPTLQKENSDLSENYREKLLLLDSAIAELKAQAARNRFNAHLQLQLATMYREKQHTLEEMLDRERKN